jgi:hypothetical protein
MADMAGDVECDICHEKFADAKRLAAHKTEKHSQSDTNKDIPPVVEHRFWRTKT